jgi:hypothetical protein
MIDQTIGEGGHDRPPGIEAMPGRSMKMPLPESVWRAEPYHCERATLTAYFSARIEATRRSVPRREVLAAVRALREEQRAAMRALTRRRQQAKIAQRYTRQLANEPSAESNKSLAPAVAQ